MLRALKHEDDFMRLLYFSVLLLRRTTVSFIWAWIASDRRVWFRVWGWRADFGRRIRKEESVKARFKDSSHGCSWELVVLYSTIQVFVKSVANFGVFCRWRWKYTGSFRKPRCLNWRRDCWKVEGALHGCYQEHGTVVWNCPQTRREPGIVEAAAWLW